MGALTFVVDAMQPGSAGAKRVVSGTATFSASYATDGDTYDPLKIGLQVIDSILLSPSLDAADNLVIMPVPVPSKNIVSTLVAGGAPPGKIRAFAVSDPMPAANVGASEAALTEIDNGTDLHLFTIRFVAWGV